MRTHSICFVGDIRKLACGYSLVSGAMDIIVLDKALSPKKVLIFLFLFKNIK